MNATLSSYSSFVIVCSTRLPPSGNMKKIFFFICFFNFLASLYATESAKSGCSEKEKALALLETAENFLTKARDDYPSCNKNVNSTDQCDNEKSLAYIKISKKLISDVREDFPSCSKPTTDDDQCVLKEEKYSDCSELLENGRNKSGIYILWPREFPTERPLKAYCDMETDGGGWTVIQRRGTFPFQLDFNKDWERYKNGFGKLTEEFWLGNENIRVLCLRGCKIRFDLQDGEGVTFFAVYEDFSLSSTNYRIDISGYSGNATDAMGKHNQYDFSTKDKDVSGKSKQYQSGWWHGNSYYTNLNGIYKLGMSGTQYVYWWKGANDYKNLASVEIKVKPN
ncbi:techylectin-5A-like [Argiope bruennichi]|uniref:techylectin-5A-like n=1 Tax=Argiope bruennichi TaxID=94029 RepID=UPI002494DDBA|nr:techylectin-5A-like [Argiope bruennichi]